MLIFLCSVVAASTVAAIAIVWLLLTGRATTTTSIPLGRRRAPRSRTTVKPVRRAHASTAPSRDNLGSASIDLTGGLAVGIGNGLTIDPSDGSLGMQIAPGISLDFDGK